LLYEQNSFSKITSQPERDPETVPADRTSTIPAADGLEANATGITIDVAYRYFVTPRRASSCHDTPVTAVHPLMATGAPAELAVLLVDARRAFGLTRRHAIIVSPWHSPRRPGVNKTDP
jgi:sulfate adenylyltransferase subunit 1 (EFTu-like GTPase family)